MAHLNQLPPVSNAISGSGLLPWERLWCPIGGQIVMDGWSINDKQRGFLAQPSKYSNHECLKISELMTGDSGLCVLSGAPGSGKSGAIRLWLDSIKEQQKDTSVIAWTSGAFGHQPNFEVLRHHPIFSESCESGRKLVIVIDGFDQFRSEGGLPFEALAATLSSVATSAMSHIRLVIGCRSRDWDANRGTSLLALWSKEEDSNRIVEICPLTRAQAVSAIESRNIPADAFLRELFEMRMEASAHWPLSLKSLLDCFDETGRLADSAKENLSHSINSLLKDHNASSHGLEPIQMELLRQCARRLAAMMLFGGSQALSRATRREPGVLLPEDFLGSSELAAERLHSSSVPVTLGVLHQLCGTALLTVVRPPSVDVPLPHLGFTHQSYSEFLAAEYVSHLEISQFRDLLTVSTVAGDRVPSQLVEVAAWLAAMRPDWFEYLLSACPEILLRSDGAQFTSEQKSRLLQVLFERAEKWDASAFAEVILLTPAFRFSGLAELICPVISNEEEHLFSRRLAIQMADKCRIEESENSLWSVLEQSSDSSLRHFAIHALHSVLRAKELSAGTLLRLRRAVRNDLGLDEDDELKGLALTLLVPRHLKPYEVAPWLKLPKKSNFHGSYKRFINEVLPSLVSETDLEAFILLGAATPSIFHAEFTAERTATSVLRLFASVETPSATMRSAFIGWVIRCAKRNAVMPLTETSDDYQVSAPLVDEWKRHEWLEWVIREARPSPDSTQAILRALMIVRPSLGWSLVRLMAAIPDEREAWSSVVKSTIGSSQERESCLPRLLEAYETIPELRAALIPCREGMNIHESYQALVQEWQEREAEYARKSKKPNKKQLTRRRWMDQTFKTWLDGNDLAWLHMWKGCALSMDGTTYDWSGGERITDWEGWKSLTMEEQAEVRRCARAFLVERDDTHRDSEKWRQTNWSEAAHYAVGLLVENASGDTELCDAISEKWVRAWLGHFHDPNDCNRAIAGNLYRLDREACISVFKERFVGENSANQDLRTAKIFAKCWDGNLSAALENLLNSRDVSPRTLRSGLELLSNQDPETATRVSSCWMDRLESADGLTSEKLRDSILFSSLFFTAANLFERVHPHFSNPADARRIICEGGSSYDTAEGGLASTLAAMSKEQAAKLAVITANAFPEDANFPFGNDDDLLADAMDGEELEQRAVMRSREVTVAMQAQRVSSAVLVYYASIADADEALRFRDLLPESRRDEWSFIRTRSVRHAAEGGWTPVLPAQLLRMVQLPHACFIRSNDGLLEFIMLRLQAFAAQPWSVGLRPLWNEPHGQPPTAKEEEELSNRLKLWLDQDLKLIVNREVQPVELIGNRLDLKIEISGENRLCVIVEVKKVENTGVESSMQTQLVDTYLLAGKQTHGIYAVAWYGDKPAKLAGRTLEEMRETLESKSRELRKPETVRIECLLMDFRHPNLEPKLKKKGR